MSISRSPELASPFGAVGLETGLRPIAEVFAGMSLRRMTDVPGHMNKIRAALLAETIKGNPGKYSISPHTGISPEMLQDVVAYLRRLEQSPMLRFQDDDNYRILQSAVKKARTIQQDETIVATDFLF